MIYKLVASSRSRVTEVYQGEDDSLVQVYYFKSGATEVTPVSGIPDSLTVRYKGEAQKIWEREPITERILFPAERIA